MTLYLVKDKNENYVIIRERDYSYSFELIANSLILYSADKYSDLVLNSELNENFSFNEIEITENDQNLKFDYIDLDIIRTKKALVSYKMSTIISKTKDAIEDFLISRCINIFCISSDPDEDFDDLGEFAFNLPIFKCIVCNDIHVHTNFDVHICCNCVKTLDFKNIDKYIINQIIDELNLSNCKFKAEKKLIEIPNFLF